MWANARCWSYSASVDLQEESADLVFSGKLPVHLLISHRVPLDKIDFAFRLATHPGEFPAENPLKIIVRPQELSASTAVQSAGTTRCSRRCSTARNMSAGTCSRPAVGPDDLLVRVRAALTCGTDIKVFLRGYHARMIMPPALFGHELAGDIVAVGDRVKGFEIGQRIVAANSAPCLHCFYCRRGRVNLCEDLLFNNGAYAEFIRIPARIVRAEHLPDSARIWIIGMPPLPNRWPAS